MRTPCENKGLLGYHPVTAQSGLSGRAVGSGSAVAVYPIPEKLVKSLAEEMRRELAVDPLPLYMIMSITEEMDSLEDTDVETDWLHFGGGLEHYGVPTYDS